ncbi:hypothetical protein FACS1894190_17880 [Spirochaetia bacterium]|nr:hypothetical protein FACS1894190_17880 [Spirochaetia bacterium]
MRGLFFLKKTALLALFLAAAGGLSAQQYWTGSGGKGTSLAVLVPTGNGLADDEKYLPTLVQGVFVGDLSNFSAMSVLDRQNLDKVLKETESGVYKNEAEYMQLGEVANVGYALTGTLQKTKSGYNMALPTQKPALQKPPTTAVAPLPSCTTLQV